jgi:hypothetical protein
MGKPLDTVNAIFALAKSWVTSMTKKTASGAA